MSPPADSLMPDYLLTVINKPNLTVAPGHVTQFFADQEIEVLVVSRDGDFYLLQHNEKRFYAKSENPLPVGSRIRLVVMEKKGNNFILKRITKDDLESTENPDNLRLILEKFGVSGAKDLKNIETLLAKIPAENSQGIRYLLNPHLLAALILPQNQAFTGEEKIEITKYENQRGGHSIWEIRLESKLRTLGLVETVLKYVDGKIYGQIWAEKTDTEEAIRKNMGTLKEIVPDMEMLIKSSGPLLLRPEQENIDLRV